jgi:5-formyltetrahydrofolate cyclo-ligase
MRHAMATASFRRARRIGLYWPIDGELDTRPLLAHALAAGKQVYLPGFAGCPPGQMRWRPLAPGLPLRRLRFGVTEPVAPRRAIDPRRLDLVFTPLVAFDDHGHRLGMGGGFYDRCFAFLAGPARRPELIGLAYHFQRVPEIQAQPWDVPLAAVITERGVFRAPSLPQPSTH